MGDYPPRMSHLVAYYPGSHPPMMALESLQPRLHQLQTLSMESLGTYSDYEDPSRAMLHPQQRSRRRQQSGSEHVKHRRTRSGCYTCRQRRVKCDEVQPVCDRCRKGKRECTYPGTTSSSTPSSIARPARSGSRSKDFPGGSTPSGSDEEDDQKMLLDAILDEDEGEGFDECEAASASPLRRRPSDTSSLSPSAGTVARGSQRPHPLRTTSRQTDQSEASQSSRWNSLPGDIKRFLTFYRENMSHHHYAFKYDGDNFLKTTFLEIALNDSSTSLLYAIVAFAAYHYAISHNDDNISIFLSYYNKSIAHLQQSLKSKRHNVSTLLTILQLATIEEFLGDWVNLLGHQKAALQILTDLFSPQTVMQDETWRKIINWYIRFDLFASMMSGGEPTLEREWFAAAAEFYRRQARDKPDDLGAQFEEYSATSRLLATDVALLFATKSSNAIDGQRFLAVAQKLSSDFAEYGHTIESAFRDDPSCFVNFSPRASMSRDDELFDYRDPNFLYAGELSTMNFVLLDHWAMDLMFKFQITLALGQSPSQELTDMAMKQCKMVEAIQYGEESGSTAVLGCQASLGMMPLFLPNDDKYVMWCRQKFTDIERLGYIYPASLRERHGARWFPDDESYPSTVQTVKEFVRYRATRPTDAWTEQLRDMSGIFKDAMKIDEV